MQSATVDQANAGFLIPNRVNWFQFDCHFTVTRLTVLEH